MAGGMIGANPDELRALSTVFGQRAEDARSAKQVTAPEVEGVEWEGPDADQFRRRYESIAAPKLLSLADLLDQAKDELARQAGEQDVCSLPKGGGPGTPGNPDPANPGNPGGPNDPGLIGAIRMLYKDWNFFRKPGQFLRFGLEAIAALSKPGSLIAPWFAGGRAWREWTTLTGRLIGTGGDIAKGLTIEARAAQMFGPLYNGLKNYTDLLGGNNWLSKPLENLMSPGTRDAVIDFVGKEGRLAARGLGALGVGFDGYDTFTAARDGNWTGNGDMTKGALWNGAQTVAGALCFVPGPVGWVATGVSAGMAVYENWDTISNGAQQLWNNGAAAIQDAGSKLMDHGSQILSGLNPFD